MNNTVVAFGRNMVPLEKRLTRIRECWQETHVNYIDGIIKTGQELIAAQDEHGDSLLSMADKLPFDRTTALRLMAIAKSACAHGHNRILLPASWKTLYELSQLPEAVLQAALADGRIKPNMTRAQASALKPPKEPTGGSGKVLDMFKRSAGGMTTDAAKRALSDIHPLTVNSAVNSLAKRGFLVDSGQKRKNRDDRGRKAIVYKYNPNPQPLKKAKAGKKASTKTPERSLRQIEQELVDKVPEKQREQEANRLMRLLGVSEPKPAGPPDASVTPPLALDAARAAYIAAGTPLSVDQRIKEVRKVLDGWDLAIHKHFIHTITFKR
jgi:predicted transcriptional regulator